VVEVTDEDNVPITTEDLRNYELEEDMSMSSPESSIMANKCNYDPELEPVPSVVPPEQQVPSSRATLDDPPPSDACFLRFCLCPIEKLSPTSCSSFVEEIVQQVTEGEVAVRRIENVLLFMSVVFSQVGNILGQQHCGGKGKGKEHAS
jgi:hypothetical protein